MFSSTELYTSSHSILQATGSRPPFLHLRGGTTFGTSFAHKDMRLPEKQLFGLPVTLDLPEAMQRFAVVGQERCNVEMEVSYVYKNLA